MKKFLFVSLFLALASLSSFGQTSNHFAQMDWTQSVTPGITSNNVYKSVNCTGTYTLLFASAGPMITYTDNSVTGGQKVCYTVTALINSTESPKSNVITVNVPPDPSAPTGLTATKVQ
jgi:hypothetical protein